MVRRLRPYFANVQKRLTKSPKLYIRDTGLLHFLAGLRRAAELPTWARAGYLNWDVAEHRERILKRELPQARLWVFDEVHRYRLGWSLVPNHAARFENLVAAHLLSRSRRVGGEDRAQEAHAHRPAQELVVGTSTSPGGWSRGARLQSVAEATVRREEFEAAVDELVETYRLRCLWFLRPGYRPRSDEERLRVLDAIERHGDREAYRRAATLRTWLSRTSSAASAAS